LTRIGRFQVEKLSVKLLSLPGIVGENYRIWCWGASSDRDSKDSNKEEGRKLHVVIMTGNYWRSFKTLEKEPWLKKE